MFHISVTIWMRFFCSLLRSQTHSAAAKKKNFKKQNFKVKYILKHYAPVWY